MKIINSILLIIISTSLIACSETGLIKNSQEQSPEPYKYSNNKGIVSGTVIEKLSQGRDGTIWKFKGDNGQTYSLIVSIPNLGEEQSKNIPLVQPNSRLEITGDTFKLGSENRLVAREIKSSM